MLVGFAASFEDDFADSSAFFLPKLNRLRFFFFSSASGAGRRVEVPVPESDPEGSATL